MNTALGPPGYRFRRAQFEAMVAADIFGADDRLELLNGEIIPMAPQKSRHATAVVLVAEALRGAFGGACTLRCQLPFALDDHSEPEPDLAVVPGDPRRYRDAHPDQALLICEVADTTLTYDRGAKLAAYGRAGVPEYWVLDLNGAALEVCRRPQVDGYAERRWLSAADAVAPLNRPGALVRIADLLP